jgi:hypothetical protein
MSTGQGRNIGFSQFGEGVRASLGRYLPSGWPPRTPYMTLDDNTVYYDRESVTSALMQYSFIKILLLSRTRTLSRDNLTILPFPPPTRRTSRQSLRYVRVATSESWPAN